MSNDYEMAETPKKPKSDHRMVRAKLAVSSGAVALMGMVGMVSAGELNDSVSPILADVASLFTPLLTLILAVIPLVIATAVIGFVLGIFESIIHKIKM
jgi:hypothetical protein